MVSFFTEKITGLPPSVIETEIYDMIIWLKSFVSNNLEFLEKS